MIAGQRVTHEAFRQLRYVHGWEVVEPLARVDEPPGPWCSEGVVGRDKNGEYVRASLFDWESTTRVFESLPPVYLADHKDYGNMNDY